MEPWEQNPDGVVGAGVCFCQIWERCTMAAWVDFLGQEYPQEILSLA